MMMEGIVVHPPHVHRLLRLIREGTPSHASRASILLGRYAASCCTGVATNNLKKEVEDDAPSNDGISEKEDNSSDKVTHVVNPGLIIWDLIGRLVGGDGNNINNTATDNDVGNNKKKRSKKSKKKKDDRPTSGLFDSN